MQRNWKARAMATTVAACLSCAVLVTASQRGRGSPSGARGSPGTQTSDTGSSTGSHSSAQAQGSSQTNPQTLPGESVTPNQPSSAGRNGSTTATPTFDRGENPPISNSGQAPDQRTSTPTSTPEGTRPTVAPGDVSAPSGRRTGGSGSATGTGGPTMPATTGTSGELTRGDPQSDGLGVAAAILLVIVGLALGFVAGVYFSRSFTLVRRNR